MTKHEKAAHLFVTLEKTRDHLEGVSNEPEYPPILGPNSYSQRSSPIPSSSKIQDILPLLAEEVSTLSDREERESETIPAPEVLRGED